MYIYMQEAHTMCTADMQWILRYELHTFLYLITAVLHNKNLIVTSVLDKKWIVNFKKL